jgi:hypothetical protein
MESFTLPAKVSFVELATKPAAELPEKLRKKQLELWDFVSGTSQRSWLDRLAPVVARAGATDEELGAQLTEQYGRAIGGMTEVLKFGAMMMMLRQHIDSTRGVDRDGGKKSGAKYDADTGVKAWLKRFAPEIKHATAYRFLHVAESVMAAFAVPAKISFVELATTPAAELPEKLQRKQTELREFANGTSQKSWLDQITPRQSYLPTGGARVSAKEPPAPEQAPADAERAAITAWKDLMLLFDDFFTQGHHLNLAANVREQLDDFLAQAREKLAAVNKK